MRKSLEFYNKIGFVFGMFFLLSVCNPLFSQSIILDSASIDAITPNIAADGIGNVAVFWSADYASLRHPQNLYNVYSSDGGSTFTFPTLFPFYGNGNYYINVQPNLVYDQTGKLNFVWSLVTDIIGPVYSKSTNYGLSWRSKIETSALGYNVYPRNYGIALAVSADGQIVRIVWYNCASADSSNRIYSGLSTDGGTTWATENITLLVGTVSLTGCYMSSAVMSTNSNFFCLSQKNDKLNITRFIGTLWSSVDITPINNSLSLANEHSIAIDTNDNLFVTWSQDGRVYISKSTNQGNTWSPKVIVDSSQNAIQDKPVIGLDSHGQLIVVWQDSRNGSSHQIRWAESIDGGYTWTNSSEVSPSSADQNEPDMVVVGRKLHIVWIESGSTIYSSVNRPIGGDVDRLGHVDFGDFALLANNWGITGDVTWQMGDLNGDMIVDMMDMAILAQYWLESEIPAMAHLPLYNNDNLFPNSTFDEFVENLPLGWTF